MALAWAGPYCVFIHCGDQSRRPQPWRIPQRRLSHYLLVCNREGREQITVEGRDYPIAAGESYLVAPGSLHTLTSPANQPAWLHFDVRFDPHRGITPGAEPYSTHSQALRERLQPSPREVWEVELPVVVPADLCARFAAAVPRIIASWQRGGAIDLLEANHQLGGLLLDLVARQRQGEPGEDTSENRIARAEAVADRSLGSGFSVDDFAAAAGYSRSRFSALYLQLRGVSPGHYLRRERMRLACTLLERDELTVGMVGALVGYGDPTVFGRAFRSQLGSTPGDYRRTHPPGGRRRKA
jgi:AraC-like DNA-binding protein